MTEPFDPLAVTNLAESLVNRIISTEPTPMSAIPRFNGAGIYALYYTGPFPAYALLAERNRYGAYQEPIYIGKADPPGGRRGIEQSVAGHTRLCSRLTQHAAAIAEATNLELSDFAARWLVVGDIWTPLGESALIRRYQPVWNGLLDGFGGKDPGKNRQGGLQTRWDTLHPGRSKMVMLQPRDETADEIAQDVVAYLRARLL